MNTTTNQLVTDASQIVEEFERWGTRAQERVREALDANLSATFAPGQLADAIAYLTVAAVLGRATEFESADAAIRDAVRTGIRNVNASSTDPASNAAFLRLHQVWLEVATRLDLI